MRLTTDLQTAIPGLAWLSVTDFVVGSDLLFYESCAELGPSSRHCLTFHLFTKSMLRPGCSCHLKCRLRRELSGTQLEQCRRATALKMWGISLNVSTRRSAATTRLTLATTACWRVLVVSNCCRCAVAAVACCTCECSAGAVRRAGRLTQMSKSRGGRPQLPDMLSRTAE